MIQQCGCCSPSMPHEDGFAITTGGIHYIRVTPVEHAKGSVDVSAGSVWLVPVVVRSLRVCSRLEQWAAESAW